jgi:predicted nucleotidyltransferase component of viral defense system
MNDAIAAMLKQYGPLKGPEDEDNALKEIIQQITLLGLHRGKFFDKASFYGGTALRILYGLDRFSEDMDFCLTVPDKTFSFQPYIKSISDELDRYGLNARVEEKKAGPDIAIGSAFVKQDTSHGLLVINKDNHRAQKDQLLKVKLEVDKTNPPGAILCKKLVKLPVPFLVSTLEEPSLFAGKLHAIVARSYVNRVKGRDYYDLLFYVARNTPVNLTYLESKLRDSKHYNQNAPLSSKSLTKLLLEKFQSVDFEKAKLDVKPFLKGDQIESLNEWGVELFSAIAESINTESI